jgi:hypothetical protein
MKNGSLEMIQINLGILDNQWGRAVLFYRFLLIFGPEIGSRLVTMIPVLQHIRIYMFFKFGVALLPLGSVVSLSR